MIGAFHSDSIQRSTDEWGGFFMRALIVDGKELSIDIEDAYTLAI